MRIEAASMVGAYAVNFTFGPDAHRTGIFSFEQLHELGTSESAENYDV
ncbi:MAG: gamma-butyrobetaine hydroxylase-like domain-containing protein [Acidimicrobiia bacterium]